MSPVGLGFRAGRGGSVVVGVAADGGEPRVVLSTFLATAAEGDRLSFEPYHVAAGMERGAHGGASVEAAAAVAKGRERQNRLAMSGLDDIVRTLGDAGYGSVVAALLINRAGWITDLLSYSLSDPEHPRIAEGLAVRDALRFAFGQWDMAVTEMDEKSLPEVASGDLHRSRTDMDSLLKTLGQSAGRPWRKEQKLACLSAWLAVAALQRAG